MSEPRKRRSTGRVTLAEVAKLAGVGTMTVSRALRNTRSGFGQIKRTDPKSG